MIKQNWQISESDKTRILLLHELATKKNYLIFEQETEKLNSSKTPKKVESESFPISFLFPTGFHSENSVDSKGGSIVSQVAKAFNSLKEFMKKYDKPKIFNVVISSGESAVPNRDNERRDNRGIGAKLERGDLARMRSETIEKLFRINFKELVDEGLITNIPEIKIEEPILGTSTIKNSEDALKEQFVKANFIVKGIVKPPTTEECDLNVQIKIEYKPVGDNDPKYHCCDEAEFTLLLNGIPIKLQGKDTDVFSLNNKTMGGDSCGSRVQLLYIDPETAKQVLAVKVPISVEFKCRSKQCHDSPMYITVYKNGKKVEDGRYLGIAKNKKDRMGENISRIVGYMDECGKITFVDQSLLQTTGEKNN